MTDIEWHCDPDVTTIDEKGKTQYLIWRYEDDAPDAIYIGQFEQLGDAQLACRLVNGV
jgi:hypothetical protein